MACPFIDELPTEIRLTIFHKVLCPTGYIQINPVPLIIAGQGPSCVADKYGEPLERDAIRQWPRSIERTCKQIREECRGIFLQKNNFHVTLLNHERFLATPSVQHVTLHWTSHESEHIHAGDSKLYKFSQFVGNLKSLTIAAFLPHLGPSNASLNFVAAQYFEKYMSFLKSSQELLSNVEVKILMRSKHYEPSFHGFPPLKSSTMELITSLHKVVGGELWFDDVLYLKNGETSEYATQQYKEAEERARLDKENECERRRHVPIQLKRSNQHVDNSVGTMQGNMGV